MGRRLCTHSGIIHGAVRGFLITPKDVVILASLTGWSESEMMNMSLGKLANYLNLAIEHHNEINADPEKPNT